MSYGPGDVNANDWVFSGGNTFWTNLSTTVFGSGSINRPTALACRWGSNNGAAITGRSDTWTSGGPLAAYSSNYTVTATGVGSYNNAGAAATWWLANASFFGGYWRTASQNSNTPFLDGSGGNYGGLSADDGTVAGYTVNWAGVANPGGLGWFVTSSNTLIYVRRGTGYVQAQTYIRRTNAWATQLVYIRRTGAYTVLNELKPIHETLTQWQRHIPESGLAIEAWSPYYGWERAYLVEEPGWFGSVDPTGWAKFGIADWRKPGNYLGVPYPTPYTGRHNALDTEEIIDARLREHDQWLHAQTRGDLPYEPTARERGWHSRIADPVSLTV
jgi:hypothetical protein